VLDFLCQVYFIYPNNFQFHPCCCKWHNFIFLQKSSIPSYICHIFFTYSFVDGYLSCFHIFTIVYDAVMNTGEYMALWCNDFISFRYLPRCGTVGLYGSGVLIFWGSTLTFIVFAINYIILLPQNMILFPHALPAVISCLWILTILTGGR
jgi:hypothetical protein